MAARYCRYAHVRIVRFDADRRHGESTIVKLKFGRIDPKAHARGGAVAKRLSSRPEEEGNGEEFPAM